MAHHVEPMDIDSDFDNKENSLHHNNVLPFTEKGYEELDVSELNMKLRYSVTPASSPMSKSFTANCTTDNRALESGDDSLNVTVNENYNLSHSLNSTLTKNDNIIKSLKGLPLQAIPTEQFVDSNRNTSVLRTIDTATTPNNGNITVTVSGPSDIDENLSLPSSSSSALHTPEATTPTKDIPLKDGGSPIMRGLKSVLNMFRSSQSPIPPADEIKQDISSPSEEPSSSQETKSEAVLASTPIASHRKKEMSPTKRSSPQKDSSIVFNDDLEKELQWKDETTIIFSQERIPIHKLMLQQTQDNKILQKDPTEIVKQAAQDLNSTVEYMDISYNESFKDRTITEIQVNNVKSDATFGGESDGEFVDCETTFTRNKSPPFEDNDKTPLADQTQDLDLTKEIENNNDSGSRLKQIVLDTTQDILDATLSVRPEDLLPEILNQTKDVPAVVMNKTEVIDTSRETTISKDIHEESTSTQDMQPVLNQTVDITKPLVVEAKGNELDLNCTKPIAVSSNTQQINETYDASSSSINGELQMNVTKTLENILSSTQILEKSELTDPYCTKTIEVTSQAGNQTFDVSNVEYKKEFLDATKTLENILSSTQILDKNESIDPNSTKTIEAMTTSQTVNETFGVINEEYKNENVDITKTIEHILGVTQILEANEFTDPNSTKTIELASTCQNFNETFDTLQSLVNEKENLDKTKTAENRLCVTQTFERNESQDFNRTKTIEITTNAHTINQTFDTALGNEDPQKEKLNITKTLDNVLNATHVLDDQPKGISDQISDTISKVDKVLPESVVEDYILAAENPVKPTDDLGPPEETTIEPVPIPDDINTTAVQDVTMTELPVDIPLPDEDDLDKELNMQVDTTMEIIPPASLPLDLVDDIKITTTINETINIATEETGVNKSLNEIVLPEVCAPVNTSKPEDGVINETIEINYTETDKNVSNNTKQITIESEMSDICKEIMNTSLLPGSTTTSSVATSAEERVGDKEIVKCENNEINIETTIEETVNVNQTVEQINQDIINGNVLLMDINESVSTIKPLPDIINQTIALPNSVDLNTDLSGLHKANTGILENMSSKPENNQNSAGETIIQEIDTNKIEKQISSDIEKDDINSKIETNEVMEEKSTGTTLGDAIVKQEPSNISTPGLSDTGELENLTTDTTGLIADTIPIERTEQAPATEHVTSNSEAVQPVMEASNIKEGEEKIEEEIVVSENNSPFVSVIADNIPESQLSTELDNVEDPFATKAKVVLTPPSSPPIRSKGYNFNFDDMDFDPFATKTNIRMSPPLDSPNKSVETNTQDKVFVKPAPKKDINRRKSQPERKKPVAASKRKFNATFDGKINDKATEKPGEKLESDLEKDIQLQSPAVNALSLNNVTIEEKLDQTTDVIPETVQVNHPETVSKDNTEKPIETSTDISDNSIESNLNELKPTSSSSDQSAYFSACTTSSESSIPSRNVFNLPEIDDVNFNPFATKSKMRQSPPPDVDIDNPFATKCKVMSSPDSSMIVIQKNEVKTTLIEDKVETELMEKDALSNLSNSSKATDEKNITIKEINTEDEDTVEGPFLDTEDLNPDEKMSDFDGENVDMLQFNELPPQSNEENLDNGEMFIDAEAFEFLLNQNKSNTVADSGKESLFLKFDPLFAKRMSAVSSDGVLASLAKLQKRQSTPTKTARTPPKTMPSPVAGPSNLNTTQDMGMNVSEEFNDDLNITVSKPMMVVPPAVNPVTPRNKSLTPNRSNRRSITFTSPAMAVIDRLLSLSSNNSLMHDTTVTHVSREQNEADIALSQLRELLAEKEINVYNLKCESNELRDRLNTLEGHVKNLEAESEDRLKKINQLSDTLVEKTKINKSMAAVVEEYERTIASLIAETAQDKKKHAEERMKLISERDEQTAHLASMEVSFSDLHSKYEKSKQVILNCKANEDVYRKSIKEFADNLTKMHNNYELLKQHATSKLNHANQELEKINRSHEAEVLKLNAMIKRKELHITSLEESLAQKTKANDELTAICDELINKVG